MLKMVQFQAPIVELSANLDFVQEKNDEMLTLLLEWHTNASLSLHDVLQENSPITAFVEHAQVIIQ